MPMPLKRREALAARLAVLGAKPRLTQSEALSWRRRMRALKRSRQNGPRHGS